MSTGTQPDAPPKFDLRLIAGVLLLGIAAFSAWTTTRALTARQNLRFELAEISHVKYGLLNVDRWVGVLLPILDANIDALDLKASDQASLRPTIEKVLYKLLDDVKDKMSAPKPASGGGSPGAGPLGGLLGGAGGGMIANMMIGALKPHVPEYADAVLAEIGKPENKAALKNYIKSVLASGAKSTFANVDTKWYEYILKDHGCADGEACRQKLAGQIRDDDRQITFDYLTALAAAALAFAILMIGRRVLSRSAIVVLLLVCVVLLCGGVMNPMIEVEAKLSSFNLTFLGKPISFHDQVLYFQSKSVLQVFHTLVTMGRPDMWIVGVLVLMFSVVFPIIKILTLTLCMFQPAILERNRLARFFALESSKWSMADVMALAIFMSFVAFNGLIGSAMNGLRQTGADLAIPTNSSQILAGYPLFIGFCLASLFLSKKLEHGIMGQLGNR